MRPARLTLAQFFFAATALAVLVMGALLYGFLASSRRSILESSDRLRAAAARRIDERVTTALDEASDVLDSIERDANHGALGTDDSLLVETRLFSAVQNAPHVADVTFTRADGEHFDAHGDWIVAPKGRWQVSVFRTSAEEDSPIFTRLVTGEDGRFVASRRERAPGGPLLGAPLVPEGSAGDPTAHLTFSSPAAKKAEGHALWSDLHPSELDSGLPGAKQRIIVSEQKAIDDAQGISPASSRWSSCTRRLTTSCRA